MPLRRAGSRLCLTDARNRNRLSHRFRAPQTAVMAPLANGAKAARSEIRRRLYIAEFSKIRCHSDLKSKPSISPISRAANCSYGAVGKRRKGCAQRNTPPPIYCRIQQNPLSFRGLRVSDYVLAITESIATDY